ARSARARRCQVTAAMTAACSVSSSCGRSASRRSCTATASMRLACHSRLIASAGASDADIGDAHMLVILEFGTRAAEDESPLLQHHRLVADGESDIGVLLHQQDGAAALVDALDDLGHG